MIKKDRIAVVFSVLFTFLAIVVGLSGGSGPAWAPLFLGVVIVYWGFRFIKDDISFLNKKQ